MHVWPLVRVIVVILTHCNLCTLHSLSLPKIADLSQCFTTQYVSDDNSAGPPSTSQADGSLRRLLELKQSTLCKLAYVHLCLLDPSAALAYAMQALDLSQPPVVPPWPSLPENEMLAACYAAEAFSSLGREDEAAQIMGEAHDRQKGRETNLSDNAPLGHDRNHSDSMLASGSREAATSCSNNVPGGSEAGLAITSAHVHDLSITGVRRAFKTNLAVMMASGRLNARNSTACDIPEMLRVARGLAGNAACLATRHSRESPGGTTAALLAAYIDMMEDRSESALQLLKSLQG